MIRKEKVNQLIVFIAFAGFAATIVAQIINVSMDDEVDFWPVFGMGLALLIVAMGGIVYFGLTGIGFGGPNATYSPLEIMSLVFITCIIGGYFSYMIYVDVEMMGDKPDGCSNGGNIFSLLMSSVYLTLVVGLLGYIAYKLISTAQQPSPVSGLGYSSGYGGDYSGYGGYGGDSGSNYGPI